MSPNCCCQDLVVWQQAEDSLRTSQHKTSLWMIDHQCMSPARSAHASLNDFGICHSPWLTLQGDKCCLLTQRGLLPVDFAGGGYRILSVSELKHTPWSMVWLYHVWSALIWIVERRCRLCLFLVLGANFRWVLWWLFLPPLECCW